MSAAGEQGLRFLDTLYGPRTQPEPWDCAACGKTQINRAPHELHEHRLCGSCYWEAIAEASE